MDGHLTDRNEWGLEQRVLLCVHDHELFESGRMELDSADLIGFVLQDTADSLDHDNGTTSQGVEISLREQGDKIAPNPSPFHDQVEPGFAVRHSRGVQHPLELDPLAIGGSLAERFKGLCASGW